MKKYICDICRLEFGNEVSVVNFITNGYRQSDFCIDSGFFVQNRPERDICNNCHTKIGEAQEKAIKKIRENLPD